MSEAAVSKPPTRPKRKKSLKPQAAEPEEEERVLPEPAKASRFSKQHQRRGLFRGLFPWFFMGFHVFLFFFPWPFMGFSMVLPSKTPGR